MPPIPFILHGDAPAQPTGLSRILTDLTARLVAEQDALGLDVRTVGWAPYPGLPRHGTPTPGGATLPPGVNVPAAPRDVRWPAWVYSDFSSRGAEALSTAYRTWFGNRPGVVLSIWDAARLFEVREAVRALPVQWWGYLPVDAVNIHGTLGGPAAEAVRGLDRVLAYGVFGAAALGRCWGAAVREVPHLPHGIDPTIFTPEEDGTPRPWGTRLSPHYPTLGVVATNQRRKDWGLVAAVLAQLPTWQGWWHTNRLVGEDWSLPQLIEDFDLSHRVAVSLSLNDHQLAAGYRGCMATLAPGRGEGFGYPIVESLACGTPVVHADHGGGADLTPAPWRVTPYTEHLEGVYAELRPLLAPSDVVDTVEQAAEAPPEGIADYATPYHWPTLWPRWRQWVAEGLSTKGEGV